MDATTKKLLNNFALSQVALNDRSKPFPSSHILLGDLIDGAQAAAAGSASAAATSASHAATSATAAASSATAAASSATTASGYASYTPATPGNWNGNPDTVQHAIDRLAAAVYALDSNTPIP